MKKIVICIMIIFCFCVTYASAEISSPITDQAKYSIQYTNNQSVKLNYTQFATQYYSPRIINSSVYINVQRNTSYTTSLINQYLSHNATPQWVPPSTPNYIMPKRADYYSIKEVSPLPYIEKTAPEKVATWFVYSADKLAWRINWDAEARPLKYIAIHTAPNMTMEEMNAYYKANTYERRYLSSDNDPYVKGLPAHSGHFVAGKESFLPFHWVIYPNGKMFIGTEPNLVIKNNKWYVGQVDWSVGNWENNCESLSMCFILNNPKNSPTSAQISTANRLIASVKLKVSNVQIKPHYSFNSQSSCPEYEGYLEWGPKLH